MPRSQLAILVSAGLAATIFCACLDDSGPGIVGKSPQEAAATYAETACTHLAECGMTLHVCREQCTEDGECQVVCQDEFQEIDYQECYATIYPQVLRKFECADLDESQQAVVQDCLEALYVEPGCGEEPDQDSVPACKEMEGFFSGCSDLERFDPPETR